jgi:hypothetical protein
MPLENLLEGRHMLYLYTVAGWRWQAARRFTRGFR